MKLNKNQRKFFIEAINHFGENAKDVRLKDLSAFAEDNDLIMPTSALKSYCLEEGLVRGHYNLLLTGIEPEEVDEPKPIEMSTFSTKEDVIVESSSFADPPVAPKRKRVEPMRIEPGARVLQFKRPCYVVSNSEGCVIGVHETLKGAYDRRIQSFHDNGTMDYDEYEKRMKYKGAVLIGSSNSQLTCLIETKEIEQ